MNEKLEEIRERSESVPKRFGIVGKRYREDVKTLLDEIDFLRKGIKEADDMLEGLDRDILLGHVNDQLRELLEGHEHE